MRVKEHYDNHLGNIYVWMCGAFDEKRIAQQSFFERHNIIADGDQIALDLGAGHGIQSIALANLNFKVTAVDFNITLLEALKQNATNRTIDIVESELLEHLSHTIQKPALIICMGDTITHLEDLDQVESLISLSHQKLLTGGKLVLSFRDLTHTLEGEKRFIPVRSDAKRIFTCFLEYFPDKVMVHDMLHEYEDNQWILKVSAYPKLRLSEAYVSSVLLKHQFKITSTENINGMTHLVAEKA